MDTSIVVSVLAYEDTTAVANQWLARQEPGSLFTSHWLETELQSALSRKIRTGRLTVLEREAALYRFRGDVMPAIGLVDLKTDAFKLAAALSAHHELGIRAPDALHLAAAATAGHTLATFDRHLAAGATALGYAVELLA